MRKFEFPVSGVLKTSELLFSLLKSDDLIPYINISNMEYLIVPKAVELFDYFRKPLFGSLNRKKSTATLRDFNSYSIIKVGNAYMNISPEIKQILSIEIYLDKEGYSPHMVGLFNQDSFRGRWADYNTLKRFSPFNLNDKLSDYRPSVLNSSYWIIITSIATLNTIYTLFNLDKVEIASEPKYKRQAIEYLNTVSKRLKEFGSNFDEVIENLRVLDVLLSV
jgi:hypothetical protein